MDYKRLKRDAKSVKQAIKQQGDTLVAVKELHIVIPYRFVPAKLAFVGSHISTIGYFAVVSGDDYAVMSVCAMIDLTPSSTSIVKIEDEDYFVFSFDKGSVVCPNINLVIDDKNSYNTYNEFIAKGKVPWYLNYEDMGKILSTAHNYAGIELSGTNAPLELIITSIARNEKDLYSYYRNTVSSIDEQNKNPPVWVPFKSVSYGATNTAGKIMGSYFDEGLTSALTAPNSDSEGVEVYLRK